MRFVPVLLIAVCACAARQDPAPVVPAQPINPERVVYVDERGFEDGDGSRERPLKSLRRALESNSGTFTVELASGLYEGPFELRENVTVRGRSNAVVLHAASGVVVSAIGGRLEQLTVQGGVTGIRVAGAVTLLQISLSGQRQTGIEVISGVLTASGVELAASVSETVGLAVREGAKVRMEGGAWRGPFRRGVEVHGGRAELTAVRFDDSVIALHLRAGTAEVKKASARGGRGPAFIVGSGILALEEATIEGHEYGVLAGKGADLLAYIVTVQKTERAAFAFSGAKGVLRNVTVRDGGAFGGIQLSGSEVKLVSVDVSATAAGGIVINEGEVSVEKARIAAIRNLDGSSGDGILVRGGKATISDLVVSGVEGAGVVSGSHGSVTLNKALISGAAHGALVADSKGQLTASNVIAENIHEGVFAAIEGATMKVDGAEVRSTYDVPLTWADCPSGATLELRRIQTTLDPPTSACVLFEAAAP